MCDWTDEELALADARHSWVYNGWTTTNWDYRKANTSHLGAEFDRRHTDKGHVTEIDVTHGSVTFVCHTCKHRYRKDKDRRSQ